ncbi:MAG: hypothetical protein CVU33_20240 [Betaproteobacteria bacterium HGW-Betaproteobacteria-6]|jgi:hypothetical protein|nr:MAG: hypothetical protein CVU33_20240 [Betaproteobacteria bacterium HGW-Betaproteobacteria-6]
MGGAAAVARHTDDVVKGAGKAERSTWLADLKEESISFLKGDNNSPWAIFAETVIGCVPVLGQLVDARDIIKALIEISAASASPLAWFNLITALIGLIPGGGDLVKRSLRSVKMGSTRIEDLLAFIRKYYKGDPEQLIRETLDLSKIRAKFNDLLNNQSLTKQFSPEVRKSISTIKSKMNTQFAVFQQEVEGWLAKGRKTSAEAPHGKKAPGTPEGKPNSTHQEGKGTKNDQHDQASVDTPNASKSRTEHLKGLSQKAMGVIGEHLADYHCQDIKGWGSPAKHDLGLHNPAKLNDKHEMVQLWPMRARGRGIDAVWKSDGAKPYAIIEAKASYDPTRSLRALLGEAGDKTESNSGSTTPYGKKGKTGSKGNSTGAATTRQTNGKITQMSKPWVEKRLKQAVGSRYLADDIKNDGYTRHVLFFSIPHAAAHAEATIMYTAGKKVDQSMHATHQATREWRDSDIEKVVDNRAGFKDAARDRRTR